MLIFFPRLVEYGESGVRSLACYRFKRVFWKDLRIGEMKKAVIAILCLLTLAFVGVAKADQVRFYSLMPDGVELAKDIHYTVLTLEGVKIAEKTVTFEYGVTINDLPNGSYFLSAEQPSTGYFGSRKIEITGDALHMFRGEKVKDDENKLILGPDGLNKYVQDYPYSEEEIQRAQEYQAEALCGCEPTQCAPCQTRCATTCALPCSEASFCTGASSLGAWGLIAGIVPGIVIPLVVGISAEAK